MKKFCLVFFMLLLVVNLFADDDEKLKLAVMEFEDRSGTLSKQLLSDATEYLRGALISANKYIVIAKERQEQAMIKEMKKESYKECNDKNCQIPLGQALSADTILRTTITRLGKTFVIASELIDLEKEATVVGAREKYDGTENSMSEALDNIAEKVIAAYESIQNDESSRDDYNRQENNSYQNNNYNRTVDRNEKRTLVEVQENLEYNRKIKIAGYSMLGAGAGMVVIAGILLGCDRHTETAEDLDLTIGSFILFGIGGGVILTGAIMTPIGAVREKKARIELNSLAVAPTKGDAYASLGFCF